VQGLMPAQSSHCCIDHGHLRYVYNCKTALTINKKNVVLNCNKFIYCKNLYKLFEKK
jgi:hypothetical protein